MSALPRLPRWLVKDTLPGHGRRAAGPDPGPFCLRPQTLSSRSVTSQTVTHSGAFQCILPPPVSLQQLDVKA